MSIKSNDKNHVFDVVGIGNAIVDIIIKPDDSFLIKNSLTKGSMSLLDQQAAEKLYLALGTVKTHARRGLIALRKQMGTSKGEVQ